MTPEATASLAIYPLAIVALGFLVKWWMSGTERAIRDVADEVKAIVKAQGEQGKAIAILGERIERLRADHDGLERQCKVRGCEAR